MILLEFYNYAARTLEGILGFRFVWFRCRRRKKGTFLSLLPIRRNLPEKTFGAAGCLRLSKSEAGEAWGAGELCGHLLHPRLRDSSELIVKRRDEKLDSTDHTGPRIIYRDQVVVSETSLISLRLL